MNDEIKIFGVTLSQRSSVSSVILSTRSIESELDKLAYNKRHNKIQKPETKKGNLDQ